MDASLWTIVGTIAAILAVLTPFYLRWEDQRRRWTITITIADPEPGSVQMFEVMIRNDGAPDLIFPEAATVRIFERALAKEAPVPLLLGRGYHHGRPCRLQTEEEMISYTSVTGLADALRLRGCMTT